MARFVVDRRTWYRGKGCFASRLLRYDDTRCCVGFVGQQCNIPDSELLHADTVAIHRELDSDSRNAWPAWMREGTLDDIYKIYCTNDASALTDAQREQQLTELFKLHGDEIVFEN